jgi:hypothetical protein
MRDEVSIALEFPLFLGAPLMSMHGIPSLFARTALVLGDPASGTATAAALAKEGMRVGVRELTPGLMVSREGARALPPELRRFEDLVDYQRGRTVDFVSPSRVMPSIHYSDGSADYAGLVVIAAEDVPIADKVRDLVGDQSSRQMAFAGVVLVGEATRPLRSFHEVHDAEMLAHHLASGAGQGFTQQQCLEEFECEWLHSTFLPDGFRSIPSGDFDITRHGRAGDSAVMPDDFFSR